MKAVVTRRLPDSAKAKLAERFEAELNPDDRLFDRAGLRDAIQRCDVGSATLESRTAMGENRGSSSRHCEERSDEAIQLRRPSPTRRWIASLRSQ